MRKSTATASTSCYNTRLIGWNIFVGSFLGFIVNFMKKFNEFNLWVLL